jgi:hypothetical protein
MRATILGLMSAAVLLVGTSEAVLALPPPMSLEDRVADSEWVVAGRITKIADDVPANRPHGLVRCVVKVTRVFKGPADLKEVRVLCRKPTERPAAPGGGIVAVAMGSAFRRVEVGHEAIWMLVPHPMGHKFYKELFYHPVHDQDTPEAVASTVAAAADPSKVLKDNAAPKRQRLSAAYLLLRKAVPENSLPLKKSEAVEGGAAVKKQGVRDTTGLELLDARVLDSAVQTALTFFPSMKNDPWPGEHGLARKTLDKVGCPVGELMPQRKQRRRRTREQARRDAEEHRMKWAASIRKWWNENKAKIKLYVPKKVTVAKAPFDPKMAARATVVLRVRLTGLGEGSKYIWQTVEPLDVIKNESKQTFAGPLKVAHYSWAKGVPSGVSTVYLAHYNKTRGDLWKLVDGKAESGVSHPVPPEQN